MDCDAELFLGVPTEVLLDERRIEAVKACSKVREVSVSRLLGEAIRRIANDESVSKLFG